MTGGELPQPPEWGAPPGGGAPGPGWWLASDGQWYPPQQATGYPPQMPQPGYGYMPPRTNGLAVASMVLGILWIYWIGSILALVFGYSAKKQIRESRGTQTGDGMATAGIVLGWIGVGVIALVILIAILGTASSDSYDDPYNQIAALFG